MTDTVKIKITPNAVSASTEDQPDVAKLSFANNGIKSSQPLFVNDRKVIAENQYLQFDEGQGIVRAEKVYVQSEFIINGQKPLVQNDDIKMGTNGSVLVRDLKVNGSDVLLASPSLSWDETTQTLTVKNLKVLENIEVVEGNFSIIELHIH